jgi:hypothetical protein
MNVPSLCVSDGPLENIDPKDSCLIPRNIMAEPDYIEDDNPELIRPQKLINPVKSSRNHQDLHRELLMNQKRCVVSGWCFLPPGSFGVARFPFGFTKAAIACLPC